MWQLQQLQVYDFFVSNIVKREISFSEVPIPNPRIESPWSNLGHGSCWLIDPCDWGVGIYWLTSWATMPTSGAREKVVRYLLHRGKSWFYYLEQKKETIHRSTKKSRKWSPTSVHISNGHSFFYSSEVAVRGLELESTWPQCLFSPCSLSTGWTLPL